MQRLDRADALPLVAAMPVLAVFIWWMIDEGGYAPSAWMPGLVVVAIVLSLVIALPAQRGTGSRAAVCAIAAFGAYTLWSFASLLWADAPGPALEGSQRTLLYFACFACFALLPWTPRALLVLVALFALTTAISGLFTVAHVTATANPLSLFLDGRLIGPTGYQNASAALWTAGALPALVLAGRPEVVVWLRPLFLGAAGLLFGLVITTQSRGWLFTLPIVLLAALVLVPGRARLILYAAPVAGVLALISSELLEPYRQVGDLLAPQNGSMVLKSAFDGAAQSLLLATGALVAIGAVAVVVEKRLPRMANPSRRVRRGLTGALLACLVGGGIAAATVATDGQPLERIERAWADRDVDQGETSHFASLGTGRYELWRVGVNAWREDPIGGLGQDNFAQAYINERTGGKEESRWIHSLPLRLLVHTGLVGFALFALFTIAATWAAVAGWRRRAEGSLARTAGSAALLPAAVWVAHGSVDWLWEYPGLSGPALAVAGAAVALASSPPEDHWEPPPPSRRRIAVACVGGLACVAIVVPSYVADRDVREAAEHWPANPERAFDRLERARQLNPLDARASLVEGVIAVRMARLSRARLAFERAAEREPRDWFAPFELGLVAGARGDHRTALRHLLTARELNPVDPFVARAVLSARHGRTISFQAAQSEFEVRVQRRVSAILP